MGCDVEGTLTVSSPTVTPYPYKTNVLNVGYSSFWSADDRVQKVCRQNSAWRTCVDRLYSCGSIYRKVRDNDVWASDHSSSVHIISTLLLCETHFLSSTLITTSSPSLSSLRHGPRQVWCFQHPAEPRSIWTVEGRKPKGGQSRQIGRGDRRGERLAF